MVSVGEILRASPRMLVPVVRAYERRLRRYGATAQGVFWKNAEWQERRYVVLERIFDDLARAGGLVIHDFGCGYGSLFEYLADSPVMHRSRYIGTDMSQAMVDAANDRIKDPRAQFVRGVGPLEPADYTLVSGTYNMHVGADLDEWEAYVKASLIQLWERTHLGLAFNMLSHEADEKFNGLYYADPQIFLAFVRARFSMDAELVVDPPLPDFTILVRKTPRA